MAGRKVKFMLRTSEFRLQKLVQSLAYGFIVPFCPMCLAMHCCFHC